MGHGSSNSLPIMTKNTFWSYAALILLTFSTSFVINVFLSPKSCNEDLQFPMLVNMDGNVKIIVSCLICMIVLYIIETMFEGGTIMTEVATFVCCYGSWYLGFIAIQEYVFQDMGKDCMDGLSQNLLKHQSFAWFAITMSLIEYLVRFLIKFYLEIIRKCK